MFRWLCVAALGAVAILLIAEGGAPAGKTGLGALHVPPGFRVEMAAGPDLVNYPMMGTLDERGRLFLCESSGKNVTNEQMSSSPEFRIRMLEDVNGDGVYDRSTVFAEHLT